MVQGIIYSFVVRAMPLARLQRPSIALMRGAGRLTVQIIRPTSPSGMACRHEGRR